MLCWFERLNITEALFFVEFWSILRTAKNCINFDERKTKN